MTIKEANEIDLVAYLSHAGIEPVKIKGQDFWYFSPFKVEEVPTFKVDRKVNRWFDFGKGNGGTVIDFMLAIEQISIPEILTKWQHLTWFNQRFKLSRKRDLTLR